MNDFVQLISSLGFPCAVAVALMWYVKTVIDNNNAQMERLISKYEKAITEVTKALNNNTEAMRNLCNKVKG